MLPRIHIITDTTIQTQNSHFELAKLAWSKENTIVQYREKRLFEEKYQTTLFPELMEVSKYALTQNKILIINDYFSLYPKIFCNGFHLGKEDNPLSSIPDSIFETKIIGYTVHNIQELDAIGDMNLSYIGVGPIFGTESKNSGLPPLGLQNLSEICKKSPFPVITIGNMKPVNFNQVLDAGAYGAAFLSSFCKSEDPLKELEMISSVLNRYD